MPRVYSVYNDGGTRRVQYFSLLPTFRRTQVFGPEDAAATIQAAVNAAYALNGGQPDIGQFSPHRCHGKP